MIQEHHARSLHWDFRLERDGVFVSWAVPKGLPMAPGVNHLAVHVEDHPLEYGSFEGDDPRSRVRRRRTSRSGTAAPTSPPSGPTTSVKVTLHGKRVEGRYGLFQTKDENWMIHRIDPPPAGWEPLPELVRPMLATPRPASARRRRLGLRVQMGRCARRRLRRRRPDPHVVADRPRRDGLLSGAARSRRGARIAPGRPRRRDRRPRRQRPAELRGTAAEDEHHRAEPRPPARRAASRSPT